MVYFFDNSFFRVTRDTKTYDEQNFKVHHMCQFFDSKKLLKNHEDKNHRITNRKIVQLKSLILVITTATNCWLSEVILSTDRTVLSVI